jgi:molecular chaperone Hsp33
MDDHAEPPQPPFADLVQPFLLEVPGLRGRLVRMGPLVDTVISRHDYPEPVAALLGELLALAGALSSLLKFEGVFTVQTKSDGPVGLMVADLTKAGELRGYAEVDRARLDALLAVAGDEVPGAAALLGEGHIAFTVDRGPQGDRYQGIVELVGGNLADYLQHYFRQSEQLKTALKLAAGRVDGSWRSGGLLLQQIPVLMASRTEQELLDPALPANDLLYRLFHDERVRVFEPRPLVSGCRCSQARIEQVLRTLPRDEVETMTVAGEVVMTCQFCNSDYRFDAAALDRVYGAPAGRQAS